MIPDTLKEFLCAIRETHTLPRDAKFAVVSLGYFTPIDVMCGAVLKIVFGDDFEIRMLNHNDIDSLTDSYIDIGMNSSYTGDSCYGMYNDGVRKSYLTWFCREAFLGVLGDEYDAFETSVVRSVEAWGCGIVARGGVPCISLAQCIALYNVDPTSMAVDESVREHDAGLSSHQYHKAVSMAKEILLSYTYHMYCRHLYDKAIEEAIDNSPMLGYIIVGGYSNFSMSLLRSRNVEWMIYPVPFNKCYYTVRYVGILKDRWDIIPDVVVSELRNRGYDCAYVSKDRDSLKFKSLDGAVDFCVRMYRIRSGR